MSSSSSNFQGKVAIVTGATSGIGKAVAIALADAGASVVLVGRRLEEGNAAVESILKLGGKASFFQADVSKEKEVEAMVDFTVKKYGRLDLAFNNAGIYFTKSTVDVTEAEYQNIFNLNVWGVLSSMKHEIRAMLKNGSQGGSIVNCSSIVGIKGLPQLQVYSASKHAVEGLSKSVALEYAKQGIRVNTVAPGPIDTEALPADPAVRQSFTNFVPQGRLGNVNEVAVPVLYLLNPANTFVTGTRVSVDGGILA